MTVADRMAVFMAGRIVQIGTPREIFLRPASVEVAGFIGTPAMNLLPAEAGDGRVRVADAVFPVAAAAGASRPVTLGVRPSDLRVASSGIPARVELLEDLGDSVIIDFDVAGQRVKVRSGPNPSLAEGQSAHLAFEPDAAHLFHRESGERLA